MPISEQDKDPSAAPSSSQPSPAALQMVWLALLASLGLYAVVGLVVVQPGMTAGLPPEQLKLFSMVFAVIAITQTGIAMMAPRIFSQMPGFSQNILRWAIAESIGIFGLILRFMGGSTLYFLGFLVWSALLMLTLRPGQEERI